MCPDPTNSVIALKDHCVIDALQISYDDDDGDDDVASLWLSLFRKVCMLLCMSDDSREMPPYSELMHDASLAIAQVQKALNSK